MGKIKDLVIEANDLGIDTTDMSVDEVERAVTTVRRMQAYVQPLFWLACISLSIGVLGFIVVIIEKVTKS